MEAGQGQAFRVSQVHSSRQAVLSRFHILASYRDRTMDRTRTRDSHVFTYFSCGKAFTGRPFLLKNNRAEKLSTRSLFLTPVCYGRRKASFGAYGLQIFLRFQFYSRPPRMGSTTSLVIRWRERLYWQGLPKLPCGGGLKVMPDEKYVHTRGFSLIGSLSIVPLGE